MRVYIQWATSAPEDWAPYDIVSDDDVRRLPRKPVPGGEAVDTAGGWLCGMNCQGIDFTGFDHVAVEVLPGDALRITCWLDDPEDFGDSREAYEWIIRPLAPDPLIGGRLNTRQSLRVWRTEDLMPRFGPALPWSDFRRPPEALTLHGIWLPEPLFREHVAVRSMHAWDEWS